MLSGGGFSEHDERVVEGCAAVRGAGCDDPGEVAKLAVGKDTRAGLDPECAGLGGGRTVRDITKLGVGDGEDGLESAVQGEVGGVVGDGVARLVSGGSQVPEVGCDVSVGEALDGGVAGSSGVGGEGIGEVGDGDEGEGILSRKRCEWVVRFGPLFNTNEHCVHGADSEPVGEDTVCVCALIKASGLFLDPVDNNGDCVCG